MQVSGRIGEQTGWHICTVSSASWMLHWLHWLAMLPQARGDSCPSVSLMPPLEKSYMRLLRTIQVARFGSDINAGQSPVSYSPSDLLTVLPSAYLSPTLEHPLLPPPPCPSPHPPQHNSPQDWVRYYYSIQKMLHPHRKWTCHVNKLDWIPLVSAYSAGNIFSIHTFDLWVAFPISV